MGLMNSVAFALIALVLVLLIFAVIHVADSTTKGQIAARESQGNMVPVYFPPTTPGGQPTVGYTPRRPTTNIFAVLGLAFGLGGGILGVIFGFIALSQIRRTGDEGIGMAVAGIICGSLWIVITILVLFFYGADYSTSM
jgi:hypothetical protein